MCTEGGLKWSERYEHHWRRSRSVDMRAQEHMWRGEMQNIRRIRVEQIVKKGEPLTHNRNSQKKRSRRKGL